MTDEEKVRVLTGELEGRKTGLGGALRLLKDLVEARKRVGRFLKINPLPDADVVSRLKEGGPVVREGEMDTNAPELIRHAAEIARVFRQHELFTEQAVDGQVFLSDRREKVPRLHGSREFGNSDEPAIDYMRAQVLRPVYERYREAYVQLLSGEEWSHPYCPLCGSLPVIEKRVGDGGRRYLCCGLCDTSWPYVMFRCPRCQNEEQKLLSSFQIAEGSRYSADCCASCKGYIKVVDLRDSGMEDMFIELEDVKSYLLDVAAQREGLVSSTA
jgi:hypothetical protein